MKSLQHLFITQLLKKRDMKRVRIGLQQVGLVYRNNDYRRTLVSGKHWLGFNETLFVYNQLEIYNAFDDMEIALRDRTFAENIEQIYIKENEIAIVYVKNCFQTILTSGNYFYFNGNVPIKIEVFDMNSAEEITAIDRLIFKNTEVSPFVKTYKVENYEKGLLFQDGNFIRELTSGNYSFWNGSKEIEVSKVDVRNTLMEISGQELLTKDKAGIRINFQLTYRVVDVLKAVLENKDYTKQLYTDAQLALREMIGNYTLDELLQSKTAISQGILKSLSKNADKLGIEVSTAGIRDIILPGEVKNIMNQVLIAEKKAQANTIARREEAASTRTMLNTAKLMEENTTLYKLKEMDYIDKIASKIGEIKLSNGESVMGQLTQLLVK